MVWYDERRGLEFVNERVRFVELPVRGGLVPHAVEPNAAERTVVAEQFGELGSHEILITIPVAGLRPSRRTARASAREIVRMMPVELRVIEKQLDALALAFRREFPERIAL